MMIAPHAILRYLERVEGFDIEAARRRMRTVSLVEISDARLSALLEQEDLETHARVVSTITSICEDAAAAGAATVKMNGVVDAFKGGALVTVLPASNSRRKCRFVAQRSSGSAALRIVAGLAEMGDAG